MFSPPNPAVSEQSVVAAELDAAKPVVACIDNSQYLGSVCLHAAWLAARLGVGIELLHAHDPRAAASGEENLLETAAARLSDEGVPDVKIIDAPGPFLAAATEVSARASCLVLGRRGRGHAHRERRDVGGSIAALIESATCPVLVVGRLFLSLRRAVIWPAAGSPAARSAYAQLIETTNLLEGMQTERLPTADDDLEPLQSAMRWAQQATRFFAARSRPAADPDACDLVVLPRAAFLEPSRRDRTAALRALSSRKALLIV